MRKIVLPLAWVALVVLLSLGISCSKRGEFVEWQIVAKYVSAELAYVLQIERAEAKIGAREEITPLAVRSTMIFRPEDGEWKVVHRHADPITTPRPIESVIQE